MPQWPGLALEPGRRVSSFSMAAAALGLAVVMALTGLVMAFRRGPNGSRVKTARRWRVLRPGRERAMLLAGAACVLVVLAIVAVEVARNWDSLTPSLPSSAVEVEYGEVGLAPEPGSLNMMADSLQHHQVWIVPSHSAVVSVTGPAVIHQSPELVGSDVCARGLPREILLIKTRRDMQLSFWITGCSPGGDARVLLTHEGSMLASHTFRVGP